MKFNFQGLEIFIGKFERELFIQLGLFIDKLKEKNLIESLMQDIFDFGKIKVVIICLIQIVIFFLLNNASIDFFKMIQIKLKNISNEED